MDDLERAKQIASENRFELVQAAYGENWLARHTIMGDGVVLDIWVSCYGPDPLAVANAAARAKYNPGPNRAHRPVFVLR